MVGDFMPCYHPLLRVWSPSAGDWKIRPFPKDLRPGFDEAVYLKNTQDGYFGCSADFPGAVPYMTVPCGKCVGCRMEYSRQWANRCMLELEYHDSAYFVTLTYDQYHVPISFYADPETGEAHPSMTLCPRDVTLFLKRLRKMFSNDRIRYFYCGEYGPSSWRPHYHLILFGLHLDDLVYKGTRRGNNFFTSASLERCWSKTGVIRSLDGTEESVTPLAPIGFVEVGEVNWQTCAYTARYIMKKLKGSEAKFYETFALEPPFVRMSRMPGLARQWYDDHPGMRETDFINISTPSGGKKFRPPRYFDRIYDAQEPEASALMKQARQRMCIESIKAKLQRTDLSYLDYLSVEEDKFKRRIKSLQREEL
ncbi:replication initiator protein [Sigmofec virus UA08Rod_5539]|uniref:Replication initiator protein n=1 Tax=Sigmofec virus UA08Rod_5539 TaxID=2929428 RepID=A0A976R801_9VIRU|nr:replication initiator protein [Sigmofec virus UA08Rod_5539]